MDFDPSEVARHAAPVALDAMIAAGFVTLDRDREALLDALRLKIEEALGDPLAALVVEADGGSGRGQGVEG